MSTKPLEKEYEIYQLDLDKNEEMHWLAFMSKSFLDKNERKVKRENYNFVYRNVLKRGETLESLYVKFNTAHPKSFKGRSLSVSDVIVIITGDKRVAFYVDDFGFTKLDSF